MSYSGPFIYVANRPIKDIIIELRGYQKKYKNKDVYVGTRVCMSECDMHGECTCDTYSLEIKDKVIKKGNNNENCSKQKT